jgi:hypothetical protein
MCEHACLHACVRGLGSEKGQKGGGEGVGAMSCLRALPYFAAMDRLSLKHPWLLLRSLE